MFIIGNKKKVFLIFFMTNIYWQNKTIEKKDDIEYNIYDIFYAVIRNDSILALFIDFNFGTLIMVNYFFYKYIIKKELNDV